MTELRTRPIQEMLAHLKIHFRYVVGTSQESEMSQIHTQWSHFLHIGFSDRCGWQDSHNFMSIVHILPYNFLSCITSCALWPMSILPDIHGSIAELYSHD